MKYTAEEVRAIAKRLHDDITVKDGDALAASDMLTAYAERIKADEGADGNDPITEYYEDRNRARSQGGFTHPRDVQTAPTAEPTAHGEAVAWRYVNKDGRPINPWALVPTDDDSFVEYVKHRAKLAGSTVEFATQQADRAEPFNRNCDCVGPC